MDSPRIVADDQSGILQQAGKFSDCLPAGEIVHRHSGMRDDFTG